jgi:hypothetical protein
LRFRLAECLLVIVSTAAAYLAAEAAFALVGLRYVPLRLHGELPEAVRVFAQSSKAGVLPRNPVLLLAIPTHRAMATGCLSPIPMAMVNSIPVTSSRH